MCRIVFMGTPDFAVPSLQVLIDKGYDVALVVTQPDKPRGRSKQLVMPEVKAFALQYNLPVYQPQSLKTQEAVDTIAALKPNFLVVAAYGKILPKSVLDIPQKGCINVHGSLLPQYRGAAPIQWAVLNGDSVTGVTTMLMGEGLDTGDILLKKQTHIDPNETAAALFDRLSVLGAETLVETLALFDSIVPQAQDDALATYAPMINRDMCSIDWHDGAQQIHNKVRGLAEWPVAQTILGGKRIKIHSGLPAGQTQADPGTIIHSRKRLLVACGDGMSYEITSLQLEGKKRMDTVAFLAGHKIAVGERFE